VPTRRSLRVADLLVQEVADLLQRDVKDPRIGFVTLTGADLSPDLRHAKVFYTVMGDETARERTRAGLASALPFLRRETARRLRLKNVPELHFHYDESLDRGERMDRILEGTGNDDGRDDG